MNSERENETTKGGYYFISYSAVDGRDFALRLTAALERGAPPIGDDPETAYPPVRVWLDKRAPGDEGGLVHDQATSYA